MSFLLLGFFVSFIQIVDLLMPNYSDIQDNALVPFRPFDDMPLLLCNINHALLLCFLHLVVLHHHIYHIFI